MLQAHISTVISHGSVVEQNILIYLLLHINILFKFHYVKANKGFFLNGHFIFVCARLSGQFYGSEESHYSPTSPCA